MKFFSILSALLLYSTMSMGNPFPNHKILSERYLVANGYGMLNRNQIDKNIQESNERLQKRCLNENGVLGPSNVLIIDVGGSAERRFQPGFSSSPLSETLQAVCFF